MKAIEEKVSRAITSKKSMSCQNTVVAVDGNDCHVYLHSNHIFTYDYSTGGVFWDDCGWATATTRSRLNACFDAVEKMSGKNMRYSVKKGIGSVDSLLVDRA